MKIVICVSGYDTQDFLQRVLAKMPEVVQIVLLYIIDTRPAVEMNYVRRNHLFGSRIAPNRSVEVGVAEQEVAEQVLSEAADFLQSQNLNVKIARVVRRGRPEREIVGYLDEQPADLLVIGTRYSQGAGGMPEPPKPPRPPAGPDQLPPPKFKSGRGPHSIGPVARFVIDHVGCDLLLII